MRGFRGSRAAQSFNSRSERSYQRKTEREEYLRMIEQRQQPKAQPELPEWLKGLAQPERKQLPANVIPITAAKKGMAKTMTSKPKMKPAPKAKSMARAASAKRK